MGKNLDKVFTKEYIQMKRYVWLYQSSRKYIPLEADLSLMISTHFIQVAGLTAGSLDLKSEGCKRKEAEAAQSSWRLGSELPVSLGPCCTRESSHRTSQDSKGRGNKLHLSIQRVTEDQQSSITHHIFPPPLNGCLSKLALSSMFTSNPLSFINY